MAKRGGGGGEKTFADFLKVIQIGEQYVNTPCFFRVWGTFSNDRFS